MVFNNFTHIVFLSSVLLLFSFPLFSQADTDENTFIKNWQLYHNQGEYDKAIEQARLVQQLGKNTQNPELMAFAMSWEGQSFLKMPKRAAANRKTAKKLFERSLQLVATIDNKDLQLNNLQQLRTIAEIEKDTNAYAIYDKQIDEINNVITATASNKLLSQRVQELDGTLEILDSEKTLLQNKVASLSAAQMKTELLLAMQKNYLDSLEMTRMKDSFQLEKKEMVLQTQAAQLTLQQNEIQLQSSQRNFFIAIAAILMLMAIGIYLRFTGLKKYNAILNAKNEALEEEQKRSEMLLLNILPAMIAGELKANGVTKARRYEQATVMFTDFKNFSSIARALSPEELVAELDFYFKAFDEVISKFKIEKIKTIGDAYMCVGGLPDVEGSAPSDVVSAALEIQALLAQFKTEREETDKPFFEARIGIHTGPLVAGVVGSRKFAYDIWGDTVNTASRLESNGESWRVNISTTTYELVKNDFECEPRGLIPIKNGNEIAMYFVNARLN